MNFWNFIVIAMFSKLIFDVLKKVISKSHSQKIHTKNDRLDELRDNVRLTHEEQMEFISLKNPDPPKLSWKLAIVLILSSCIYLTLFFTGSFLLGHYDLNFKLWSAILFLSITSILINYILSFYNLEQDKLIVRFLKSKTKQGRLWKKRKDGS